MPRVRLDTADRDGPAARDNTRREIHIDTDIFTLLSDERMARLSSRRETIVRWLECWSGPRNG